MKKKEMSPLDTTKSPKTTKESVKGGKQVMKMGGKKKKGC